MSGEIAVARSVATLRRQVAEWRSQSDRVGLVPTMGALHAGHLALVAASQAQCAHTVVSIFVNPKQFGPREDFAAYPRPEADDLAKLVMAGADLAYIPAVDEMYPDGFTTTISLAGPAEPLEGAHRPGHFDGVATIVAKLLTQVAPDAAFFGEKDWQQLMVVRRMARDLNLPVEIVGVPTVREPDGLALSSRNVYLSAGERDIAPGLNRVMRAAAGEIARSASAGPILEHAVTELNATGFVVEYLELRDAETLAPPMRSRPQRLLAAARLGRTRLIDNLPVDNLPVPPV